MSIDKLHTECFNSGQCFSYIIMNFPKKLTTGIVRRTDGTVQEAKDKGANILANVAQVTSSIFDRVLVAGGNMSAILAERANKLVKDHEQDTETGPLAKIARTTAYHALSAAREYRLLYTIDVRQLPRLHEDEEKDLEFKYALLEELESTLGMMRPAAEQFKSIAQSAFEYGIPPESLTLALSSDAILGALIDEIVNYDYSEFRGHNLASMAASTTATISKKLKRFTDSTNKKQVDAEVEEKCEAYLEYYSEKYSPYSNKRSLSKFIRALKEEYPDYDIDSWIKGNKEKFIELVRGKKRKNIGRVVNNVYTQYARAQDRQAEYIEMCLPNFFVLRTNSDFDSSIENTVKQKFYKWVAPKSESSLVGKNCSESQIREMMIDTITKRVGGEIYRKRIENIVKRATREPLSATGINEFLQDPDQIPEDIATDYQTMFPNDQFDREAYKNLLRNMFEVAEQSTLRDVDKVKMEHFTSLEARLRKIFKTANDHIADEFQDSGIENVPLDDVVMNANEYYELIRIAVTSPDPKRAWDARLKIGKAFSIYHTIYNRKYRFKKHDARQAEIRMELPEDGIKIDPTPVLVKYFEDKNGNVTLVDDEKNIPENVDTIGEMWLLNGTIGNIPCHFMTANGDGKDGLKFIGTKSLKSCTSKQVRKAISAKDTTDLQRMTIVTDNPEDKAAIVEYLSKNYFNMFRKVSATSYGNGEKNAEYTSDQYKADKYLIDVLIIGDVKGQMTVDETGYLVTVEVRFVDTYTAACEKSKNHPISHKVFEKKRALESVVKYRPRSRFPELYMEQEIDKDNLLAKRNNGVAERYVLKTEA